MIKTQTIRLAQTLVGLLLAVPFLATGQRACAQAAEEPLFLRDPVDVIVLRKAKGGGEVELAPDSNRRVPNPLPASGGLRTRLLSNPGVEVEIPFSTIERYDTFARRLLRAALGHSRDGEFGPAYDHFARLDRDYPDEEGFQEAFASALRTEAAQLYQEGQHDHALALLESLAERAPFTPGLADNVDTIGDAILQARWDAEDYLGVRRTINTLEAQFKTLRLKVADRWRGRMTEGAELVRAKAQRMASEGRTREALQFVSGAFALDPESTATGRLLEQLSANDKTLWVGVWEPAPATAHADLDSPAALRQSRLLGGRLATLEDYEPSGGDYRAATAGLELQNDRSQVTLQFASPEAATDIARLLLHDQHSASDPLALLRRRAARVAIERPSELTIALHGAHPQPAALLTDTLPPEAMRAAPGAWRRVKPTVGAAARYQRRPGTASFNALEEFTYSDVDEAIEALRSRQLHVLERLPPWKIPTVESIPGLMVVPMRLPTIHCLMMSPESRIRGRREVVRAIDYAIARDETLRSVILGGRTRDGFEVLSAPLPLGLSLSDSLRYAYNDSVEPRPYEPRLAALLLTAARATDRSHEQAVQAATAKGESAPAPPGPQVPEMVRLAHPPTPIARVAAEAIRDQLRPVGMKVELVEATEVQLAAGAVDYDLRYAELTLGEPLVDVWRLLGPGGLAGDCSPAMLAGLDAVVEARTGKDAAARLRDLHRVIAADVPVIPLWQTAEYFACQDNLRGVRDEQIDLYQTIDQWRVGGGAR